MNYILFDSPARVDLFPFTHTRPVADIRCGILTMRERWELLLGARTGTLTEPYLATLFAGPAMEESDTLYISAAAFATKELAKQVLALDAGMTLADSEGYRIAARMPATEGNPAAFVAQIEQLPVSSYPKKVMRLANVWDIFAMNEDAIKQDFELVTAGRTCSLPEGVAISGRDKVFIEEGAVVCAGSIINATTGPVYIARGAEIWEGVLIRGPFAACEGSVLKMGAKVYGATTIGPGSKVGGEVSNVVFFSNSNKAHDGFLGNAVIGEWCNLGADTNASNLKNNYETVKIIHEASGRNISTGRAFCGLLMGDHSKCGINTMFNTGTVVGVSCNIYGGGFPDKYIPSFSWGGSEGFELYKFDKAMATASRVYARRNKELSEAEKAMYQYVYDNRKVRG